MKYQETIRSLHINKIGLLVDTVLLTMFEKIWIVVPFGSIKVQACKKHFQMVSDSPELSGFYWKKILTDVDDKYVTIISIEQFYLEVIYIKRASHTYKHDYNVALS